MVWTLEDRIEARSATSANTMSMQLQMNENTYTKCCSANCPLGNRPTPKCTRECKIDGAYSIGTLINRKSYLCIQCRGCGRAKGPLYKENEENEEKEKQKDEVLRQWAAKEGGLTLETLKVMLSHIKQSLMATYPSNSITREQAIEDVKSIGEIVALPNTDNTVVDRFEAIQDAMCLAKVPQTELSSNASSFAHSSTLHEDRLFNQKVSDLCAQL
jgi:hypothetical protein